MKRSLQEQLIYAERKMIVANYCNHKFKYWWYKRQVEKLKMKIQKEGLDG